MIEDSLSPLDEDLEFEVSSSGERITSLMRHLSDFGFKVKDVRVIRDIILFEIERNTYLLRKLESQLKDFNFYIEGDGICYPI